MRIVKWIITAAFIIFWVVFIPQEFGRFKLRLLNQLMPASYEEILSAHVLDKKSLIKCTLYFKALTWVLPQNPDGHELLAVCYFDLGQERKAGLSLQKAIALNPKFFWSQYNLGIFMLKKKDFPAAARYFETALKLEPQETLAQILYSRIYQDVMRKNQVQSEDLVRNLKLGYQEAGIFFKMATASREFNGPWRLKTF